MFDYFVVPFNAMGSRCEIKLYAHEPKHAQRVAAQAIQTVKRLERRYSRYLDDNRLSAINRAAKAGASIEVDEETAGLLNYAEACYLNSDGLFDISSGILRVAWDFGSAGLPEQSRIEALLPRIGWDKLSWRAPLLSFSRPGMELDFGGIVKEYAADQCAVICQQAGIGHGLINLGGDIRIIGPHPDGSPWSVGIRHPRDKNRHYSHIRLESGAVSSSGDYERCIRIGDRYYSHILDPRSGWPVSGLASVTVIAEHCLVAGSLSTIAMLKATAGESWLRENAVRALWVDINGNCGESP
nr:FAD:protein FMN transferase [Methylomarinum sp. Ch1-1]MDP4522820.1 FAD:protein FMN transferase [Methylomarinum sp. Ch1-1]